MVTRRELGFLLAGGGGTATAAYLARGGDPSTLVDGAGSGGMSDRFAVSSEFAGVEWTQDGWITIETEAEADGESIALAPGDVADPMSVEHVSSNIAERGATVEFGLAEAIRSREFRQVSIGSYRVQRADDTATGAERLDVVTVDVPDQVLEKVRD